MAKTGTADDNIFGEVKKVAPKKGLQDDGSYIRSDGSVSPPREPRRVPYPEPEEKQVDGNEEVVETPDGSVSFLATRMTTKEFASVAQHLERKRLKCMYRISETYAGQPRPFYSYDELEQLRRGELKR